MFEQVKTLAPWQLMRVQMSRTPMQRRLPNEVLQQGCKHRGAALWLADGSVSIEAESVASILAQSATRFATPVRAALFFYGVAPDTSLNEDENSKPEPDTSKMQQQSSTSDDTDQMKPHQPGFRDITFPGLGGDVPKWLLQVMRRIHTNLGHPATAALVRHLSAAGASEQALRAARHLQCAVCRRVQPPREPRPAKAFTPRRFNDRLSMDVLWLKDIRGRSYAFLNQLDEATCYQALTHLKDRSETEVISALLNGWFAFFGMPDEVVLDSDGAFRGLRFESLQAQCDIKIRYVPADAHYQMGRVERRGMSIKYIVQRLVSQFSPCNASELCMLTAMATNAKNNLLRRSGSTPAQWVYGRAHKLPGALLSSGGTLESCQLANDSDALRRIEAIRAEAMSLFHKFEYDSSLRAALLRKPRPYRGPFHVGQKIAYHRTKNSMDGEGILEGYRQGLVIAEDGQSLWVRNNRGRLVLVSKEQCRDVCGEEEWWQPDQADLDLLKNCDQDLARKHALAFQPPLRPPTPAGDERVLDELAAAPDALPPHPAEPEIPALPPLDAAGQPVLTDTAAPLVAPLMIVPPTPRGGRSPGTPRPSTPSRTSSRARSTTPRRSLRPLAPVPEETPPTLSTIPSVPKADSERQALPLRGPAPKADSERQALPLRGPVPEADSERQALPLRGPLDASVSGDPSRRSSGESGLTAQLERVIAEEYPEHAYRGVKRQTPEEPEASASARRESEPTAFSSTLLALLSTTVLTSSPL